MKRYYSLILLSLSLSAMADCRIKIESTVQDPQMDFLVRLVENAGYRLHEISPNILYFNGSAGIHDASKKRMKYTSEVTLDKHGSRPPKTIFESKVTEVGIREGVIPWVKSIQQVMASFPKCD